MAVTLAATQVTMQRQGRRLLQDINFEIGCGEMVALLGPNGAGKTSLLNILNGQIKADSGSVTMAGQPLADWSLSNKAKHLASLAQQSLLNFPYKVSDVIALGRLPHSSGKQQDWQWVKQAMTAMDVGHLANCIYTQLSGGEKQRVQLARVMVQLWPQTQNSDQAFVGDEVSGDDEFGFLLLDEPTAALDLAHQQLVLQACAERVQKNCAAVVVLHDINLAMRFSHRLVLMAEGQIIANGSPDDIARPELIKRVFGIDAHIIEHPLHRCPHIVF